MYGLQATKFLFASCLPLGVRRQEADARKARARKTKADSQALERAFFLPSAVCRLPSAV
jgi:hypothetical protein